MDNYSQYHNHSTEPVGQPGATRKKTSLQPLPIDHRFVAFLIDLAVGSSVIYFLTKRFVFSYLAQSGQYDVSNLQLSPLAVDFTLIELAVIAIGLQFYHFLSWLLFSTTIGKRAVNARIVDLRTGGEPTASQLSLRFVCYVLGQLGVGLGLLSALKDKNFQAWHDRVAQTMVIVNQSREAAEAYQQPIRSSAPRMARDSSTGSGISEKAHSVLHVWSLSLLLPLVGILLLGVVLLLALPMDTLKQFVGPGEFEFTVNEAGDYTIWNEYKSFFNSRVVNSSKSFPAGFHLQLAEAASGRHAQLEYSSRVTFSSGQFERKSIAHVYLTPGRYRIVIDGNFAPRVFSIGESMGNLFSAAYLFPLVLAVLLIFAGGLYALRYRL